MKIGFGRLDCADCAKLKKENERLKREAVWLEYLIAKIQLEIDLMAAQRDSDDTRQKTDGGEKLNGLRQD